MALPASDAIVAASNGGSQVPTSARPNGQHAQAEALAAPFDVYYTDVRGGVDIAYPDGWQVITRLNDVLGVGRWGFTILHREYDAEADEVWVQGRLLADVDGMPVTFEQFGGGKVKRATSICTVCGLKANAYHAQNAKREDFAAHKAETDGPGTPMNLADDYKGAATDCLKKCATLLGVGLYFSRRDGTPLPGRPIASTRGQATRAAQPQASSAPRQAPPQQPQPAQQQQRPPAQPQQAPAAAGKDDEYRCSARECGDPVKKVRYKDKEWGVDAIVNASLDEFQRVFCGRHLLAAREARAQHATAQAANQTAAGSR